MFKFRTLACIEPEGKYHGFDPDKDKIANEAMLDFVESARERTWIMTKAVNEESGIFVAPMRMAFEKVLMRFLLLACKKYAAAKYAPKKPAKGEDKVELLVQGLESKRRDNPLFARDAVETVLDMMLVQGSTNEELIAYARAQNELLLTNQIPKERLVMSKNISKPLARYKNKKEHHVVVARAMIRAGIPVVPGDRVELIYVCAHGKDASDKVMSFQLHKDECEARRPARD